MTQIDAVQFQIEKAVMTGDFPPNTRLPSERELAVAFNTSRNSIRETIARLAMLGIVSTRPQSGSYVEDVKQASLDVQLSLFQRHGIYNTALAKGMVSLCSCIEIRAAETAASSEQHLAHAQRLEACVDDADYHAYLISTADNPVFEAVFRSMIPLFTWLYRKIDDIQEQELAWHRERVKQAVQEGNSLLAVRSMGLYFETLATYVTGPTKREEAVQG